MKNTLRILTRRELLAHGAALGGIAMTGTPSILFAQNSAMPASEMENPLDELRGILHGELVTPADGSYDEVRKLWNGMIDKRPSAIARCSGTADVINAVKYARNKNLAVTVRGGGHNVAGKALRDGAVAIDLSSMRGIRVDPEGKNARVQGGARWADFDHETLAFNLVCTGGTVSSTGVGGLTLGGGLGWLMRKHGLSCDNLLAADIVTADGRMLVASKSENDDLFWAIRGGGGNFGVVTSFEFGLHDLEPIVGGIAMYPESILKEMLPFFRSFTESVPDSVTAMAGVFVGPPGTPVEGQNAGFIAACHSGPTSEGERLLKPIKEFGPPAVDLIGPMPYSAIQKMFDAGSAPGARNYWRSNFVRQLGDDVIDLITSRADGLPRPGSMILIEHLQGAVGRVGVNATAFSGRDAEYNVSVLSSWIDQAQDPANIAWTRAIGDEVKAYATGGAYVNYMMADESAERVHATYEANFQRLVDIKRKYDPTNFFSGNQNIKP